MYICSFNYRIVLVLSGKVLITSGIPRTNVTAFKPSTEQSWMRILFQQLMQIPMCMQKRQTKFLSIRFNNATRITLHDMVLEATCHCEELQETPSDNATVRHLKKPNCRNVQYKLLIAQLYTQVLMFVKHKTTHKELLELKFKQKISQGILTRIWKTGFWGCCSAGLVKMSCIINKIEIFAGNFKQDEAEVDMYISILPLYVRWNEEPNKYLNCSFAQHVPRGQLTR